jgi:hypothetical protein
MATVFVKLAPAIIAPFLILLAGVNGHAYLRRTINNANSNYTIVYPLLCILAGATAIGLVIYVLSLFHLLRPSVIGVLLLAQLSLAIFNLDFFSSLKSSAITFLRQTALLPTTGKLLVGMSIFLFSLFVTTGLAAAIVPNLESDTSTTYLNAAKLFLQHHTFIDIGNLIGSTGKTGFLHLIYGMALSSANLAHAWVFLLAAVGFLLIFLLAGLIAGYSFASLLFVILITSRYAHDSIIIPAKFDGISFALAAAVICMMYMFHNSLKQQGEGLLVTSLMCGFLAGLSYNNIFFCGLFMFWAAWLLYMQGRVRIGLSIRLCAAIITGAAPTYLHNIIVFGNPVYPFASSIFGVGLGTTIPTDSFTYIYLAQQLSDEFAAKSLTEATTLLQSLFSPGYDARIQSRFDPWLGAVMFTALAGSTLFFVILLPSIKRLSLQDSETVRFLIPVIAILWISYFAWAFTQHILRYASTIIPLAFVTTAWLFKLVGKSAKESAKHKRLLKGLIFAVIALILLKWVFSHAKNDFRPIIKEARLWAIDSRSVDDYISSQYIYGSGLRFGQAIVGFKSLLKPGDKVLSFINGNAYFAEDVKVFYGVGSTTLPSPVAMTKALSQYSTYEEWLTDLKSKGFCCIILNSNYLYLSEAERPILAGFINGKKPAASIEGTSFYYL